MRGLTAGAVLALITLVAACSGAGTAAPPPTSTFSTSSTGSPSPTTQQATPPAEVNCGASAEAKAVIAERTEAGLVECAEAMAVMTEYHRLAPEEDEAVTIQGWTCAADSGDEGTGIVVCEKDGKSFHTGQ
ncbi:hypothetical protein [Kibdelosporangium phytohabitans]|uniref:Uncharacterized protein n=1 Tax=Kibdelosporangium phytohabitans TaxID=860235 RepID=A0A0N9I3U1_9PSEU|nr:hypothetical protein [Kibdelosporangium phytohabitans]ALG09459.1 hypothetical protein AOZ06_23390 [Kibdelosporangium phytohabitans]MBE1469251.1 hypothetical protein [Kibdelosporangium phytohabitans]